MPQAVYSVLKVLQLATLTKRQTVFKPIQHLPFFTLEVLFDVLGGHLSQI